ncbi:PWWP domain-containing protein 5-like [Vicia villosa]|uniref:PWWP domain-containing protein 5-like n=1 Tax=Vicia villosa TaxID=3911 RepID=UPI00273CE7CE|nr:PWWP domain-containing protein 5-like [Vicia villosa]
MAGQTETLDNSIDGVLGASGAELNHDLGFHGSIGEGKDVNPVIEGVLGFESEKIELGGDEAALKTLDENKEVVSEILEKEVVMSDVAEVELEEGKVGVSEKIDDLHIDGVLEASDADLNEDLGFDGSIEKGKDVNPIVEGVSGVEGFVRSLEGNIESEMIELGGNEAALKTLDEKKVVVSEILEKEVVMSDVVEVELDEGKVGISEKIDDSHEELEFSDAEEVKVKAKGGKVVKYVSMKSSGKSYQARYQLPVEKEGKFSMNDLVWGKVRSHPWWPGQIFDPLDSSAKAMKHFKKNRYLVAYYGDGTYAWNEGSKLKSFRSHFSYIEKNKKSEAFQSAVDSALDEVKRRVEFGLACSCIPKDTYDKIKHQTIENCGIQQEPSFVNRVDDSLSVSSFLPEKLIEYLKDLSKFPTEGFDRLELLIAKTQLLAFYRLKGYSCLPEFQYFRGLDDDINPSINDTDKRLSEVNEHTIHVGEIGDQTGTGDSKAINKSRRKRKHHLKDDVYPAKKKSLLEQASVTPDSTHGDYQNDEAIANLTYPVLSKKRKTINLYADVSGMKSRTKTISLKKSSNTTIQSFKIGECIRRVASQLTGPPSLLKCSGDRSQTADGNVDSFSGNEFDSFSPNFEETQNSSLTFPTEVSSLDDLLSLLQRVAQEPQGDYSFLNVIVSFFSDFRNSIVMADDSEKEILPTNEVGTKKKKQPTGGSPETFDADDLNDTHCVQNGSEEQPQRSGRLDHQQHALSELEKPVHVYTRRSYARKQCFDNNHAEVPEKPSGYIDEKSPAELVLNFAELDSVLSETSLNNIFKHFGPLKESETEIDRGTSRARVVFKKCADAEVAFSSAKKFNIFGRSHVDYQLNYSPSAFMKTASCSIMPDEELHFNLSNVELNMV